MTFKGGLLKYWKEIKSNNALSTINEHELSIVRIAKQEGENKVNAFLTYVVADLIKSFNLGKTMDESQIEFLVETIRTDYYYLKLPELKLCFNNCKKGMYGTIYDRIDTSVVVSWIEMFLKERFNSIEKIRKTESDNHKRTLTDFHPSVVDAMKSAVSDIKKNETKPLCENIKRKKTQQELFIQQCFRDFDELCKNRNDDFASAGIRLVNIEGKEFNQDEYIIYRIEKQKNEKENEN